LLSLVKRGLADADVAQDLVDADIAKPVAVKPANGRIDQPLPRWAAHRSTRCTSSKPKVYHK
jgi:hypothetical protein